MVSDDMIELEDLLSPNISGVHEDGYHVTTEGGTEKVLDSKMIETLPKSTYSAVKNNKKVIESAVCPVCSEYYEDEDELRILPCNHAFHTECVDGWIVSHANCPYCRYNLLEAIVPESTLNLGHIVIDVRLVDDMYDGINLNNEMHPNQNRISRRLQI
ncbi:hypothetical protein MKW94_009176 [Papaver nudicaule]|uniref:RING-type domain-containing protein n=1 Tax=Papaver nudicaule TaxID=74823 RepID=A0AA41S634_PAPNU|nr:hypothetical protein [Papaver nudicaule]